jgi:hypothetical protein
MSTRRTRSILVDATLGKIFTNTTSVQAADASKLIAGTKIASAAIASVPKTAPAKVVKNLAGTATGIRFSAGGLVTGVIITAATASVGRSILFDIKMGTSYETATVVSSQELPVGMKSKTVSVSLTVPAGSSLYVDVTQVGNIKPGVGLGMQFNYYAG